MPRHMRFGPVFLACILTAPVLSQSFDIVISHGRVIDPETNLDALRNVGIRGGKIAAISESPLTGDVIVDAEGLVVAPGFIDIHQHGQTEQNYEVKARDGVTTALEMEVGIESVLPWYARRQGKSSINFGASVGHIPVRIAVLKDTG